MDGSACAANEPFALRVIGDSMEPEFNDGCIIIIEPTNASGVKDSSYVLAEQEGEYIFRQLILKEERYYLKPLNSQYFTIEIPNLDVVKGLIVQRAGKRRKDAKHYI